MNYLYAILLFFGLLKPPALVPTLPPSPTPLVTEFVPPISNYASRLTVRKFGQLVTPADAKTLVCGATFTGYHTGDDLETTPSEQNQPIPVSSVADGKIISVSWVKGYGGLIVAQYPDFTAYYGHIDLSSTTLKSGDKITRGEFLANLGRGCSSQTDGERKHLHFALHRGLSTDLRGYVSAQNQLLNWLDPSTIIKQL